MTLDGIRHLSVLRELQSLTRAERVYLLNVVADRKIRRERRQMLDVKEDLEVAERHAVEQHSNELALLADITIETIRDRY